MTWIDWTAPAVAAAGAGFVNALAGGGTLLSFPALTALGVPAIVANVTNTVALCPGYFGATIAQRRDLAGQRRRLLLILPAAALGGATGALLVFVTGAETFHALVPFLILFASALLAVQEPVRRWLLMRGSAPGSDPKWHDSSVGRAILPVALASIYGGYFGAGLSVIVLAALGLFIDDNFTRLNGLKQAVALAVNLAAAVVFVVSGRVVWPTAIVMAAGALVGGAVGGRVAASVSPVRLRTIVVLLGVVVSLIYFVR